MLFTQNETINAVSIIIFIETDDLNGSLNFPASIRKVLMYTENIDIYHDVCDRNAPFCTNFPFYLHRHTPYELINEFYSPRAIYLTAIYIGSM